MIGAFRDEPCGGLGGGHLGADSVVVLMDEERRATGQGQRQERATGQLGDRGH